MIGLSSGERSELVRLVRTLSSPPPEPAPWTPAHVEDRERVVELLARAGSREGASERSRGPDRRGRRRALNLLLISRSHDRRPVRLRARRGLGAGVIAVAFLLTAAIGTICRDYARLYDQRAALTALTGKLASNAVLIDQLGVRIRDISAEIDSWRLVRVVDPPRPDPTPASSAELAAVGVPDPSAADPGSEVYREIVHLVNRVQAEGERLRSLKRFVDTNAHLLASTPSRWPVRGPLSSDFGLRPAPIARSRRGSSPGETADPPSPRSPSDADLIPAH